MSKSITQDMAYRQSLMKYAEKYGVSRASRKYNKSRSYIYFWKQRWDGSVASLVCQSRRPHSHPNQHTDAELKLIRDMRRRNPELGMIELWHRLRQRGYTRCPESLFRVMRKMGLFPAEKPKNTYKPKPYEQMTRPGERVQVDVKVVPRKCIADPELRLFQYTAIDEFTRLRFLAAYPEQSTYSSADFLRRLTAWYARRGIKVECVQTDNGFEFTNRFSNSKRDLPTLFERTAAELGIRHKLIRPYTPWHNGKVERSHREDQKRFYSCHAFYFSGRFRKAACGPQPPLQQLTYEAPPLALSSGVLCPICLTNLQDGWTFRVFRVCARTRLRQERSRVLCPAISRLCPGENGPKSGTSRPVPGQKTGPFMHWPFSRRCNKPPAWGCAHAR